MQLHQFMALSNAGVGDIVRERGPFVCAFIINGTRRWLRMQPTNGAASYAETYLETVTPQLLAVCKLFYDHGVNTLLLPVISSKLMARGLRYQKLMAQILPSLFEHPAFLDFYRAHSLNVSCYGDYRTCFQDTALDRLVDGFDRLRDQTAVDGGPNLRFGLCAGNGVESLSKLVVAFYLDHGREPTTHELNELYFGESVAPLDLVISSGKPHVSDLPMIGAGREQLYFSVAPSLDLNRDQFRRILFDFIYNRQHQAVDYDQISADDWGGLEEFYVNHATGTLGVGARHAASGAWYPTPQVEFSTGGLIP
jgi:hypothetical protein